jgi:hypothetical protein
MKDAEVRAGRDRPGRYWQRIDQMKVGMSHNGRAFFSVEKTTVRVLEGSMTVGLGSVQVYSKASYTFFEDVKGLLGILTDTPAVEISEDDALAVVDDAQPLRYQTLELIVEASDNPKYPNVVPLRRVPAAELRKELPADVINKYYPDSILDRME